MKILDFKNMGSKIWIFATLCITSLCLLSCSEDIGISPKRQGEKPDPLTNLTFESIAGGAIISYDLPTTEDLRYVKAVYTLNNGTERIAKSSIYDNKIKVDGFASEGEYTIQLFAVSLGEVESEPSQLTIKANIPKYRVIADGFKSENNLYGTFGGLNLLFKNETKENLVLTVYRKAENNQWIGLDTSYTNAENGIFRIRGELPVESEYGITVRDQWDNISDTIIRKITPIEESMITKDMLKIFGMREYSESYKDGDFIRNWSSQGGSADMLTGFTDRTGTNMQKQWWGKGAPIPFSFTLDLGASVKLSRLKMWGRNDNQNLLFQATHVKEFEVYGSNDPNPNGSWDVWEKIASFEGHRPSGLPFGANPTAEDIAYAKEGEDFEFDSEINNTYRYIRIKVICTWNGIREAPIENPFTVAISELEIYGQIK